ncbi:asparagine synthetase B [Desulfosarcina alkanivorans]|uniref:asparagine synthase (glutamine-hydrolyzing) n=2 Tax=Desulfosarcina alkanivorans TaxID=571177 RepID=A0A5K7YCG0_9BACT|nr:asparagine synthetase B [Desulfosarcina alkanivorans]
MKKRGPDALGLHVHGGNAIGHRRLKIIDISERAHQPMVDNTLGLSIVFNGAIYNYQELRVELEKEGYCFFSHGDTEVILKAYHAWGESCVKRFNGMFAFAIVQRDSGKTFIARDRLGIKPLYYVRTANAFRFASSLPAMLVYGDISQDIDPIALHHYMTFHSVVPAPHTILKDIKKLKPGTTMTVVPDGSVKEKAYWSLDFTPSADEVKYELEDWAELLLVYLRSAIKRRLTADVPVGVLLSGGLDSSLIVGLLAELGQWNVSTFSIGFKDLNGENGNEFAYSDIIANHYSTDHHKIEAHDNQVLPSLERCISAMSEPMVSHDCIGFYLLSEAVSQHVKVVQSGQGADEIFGGYHWYPPLIDSRDGFYDYVGHFFDRPHTEYVAAVDSRFVGDDHSLDFVHRHFDQPGAQSPVDRALRIDTTVMLTDDPVKRVDNMTMAWGLEARVPFLDHELVEFAARIPAIMKVGNGGKHVLKEAARSVIPADVIDRPKGYFPVPALKYIDGDYLAFVSDTLRSEKSRQRKLFNPDYVDHVLEKPEDHITPLNGSKLWQMAVLEHWLSVHGL